MKNTRRRVKRKPIKKLNAVMRRKLVGLFALVLLALVGLVFRITYINAKSGDKYKQQVLSQSQQQYENRVLPFKRGSIYDRNGTILAASSKVYSVILDCKAVNSKEDYIEPTIKALNTVLGIGEDEVRKALTDETTKNSQYQILAKNVSMDDKKAFEEYTSLPEDMNIGDEERKEKQNIQGVWFEENYLRSYPLGNLACDTIGFTFDDNTADWGLEGYYSSTLNGVDGRQFGYFTNNSTVEQTIIEPTNGKSIVSTLDVGLQQIVEKYIQAFMKNTGAENIGVVMEDPNNGEILAMGTQDKYDLNEPRDLSTVYTETEIKSMDDSETVDALNKMWGNFCVTDAYEPGSVVKPVVMGSALQCGAIQEGNSFTCDGGESFGDSTYIKCTGSHGTESLEEVIANSCNDGMMQIGANMGAENFIKAQSTFNFGTRTGIDLPGEGTGIIHTADTMGAVELACSAFGQGFTCTMIQEISAISSVINGGYYYQPHLVSKVLDSEGGVIKTITPNLMKQTVSANISADIRSYMQASVEQGTSHYSKVQGYSSGGKTGTAEKLPRGNHKYLVSFIGFAPVDNPQIVIYVVVDEPKVEEQANSAYAQYIAQGIMKEALPYLNIKADEAYEDGTVPETTLWEGFTGIDSGNPSTDGGEDGQVLTDEDGNPLLDENGDPLTAGNGEPLTDENGDPITDENGNPVMSGGEADGTSNPNAPAPLEDDTPQEDLLGNNSESDGLTNEEAGLE